MLNNNEIKISEEQKLKSRIFKAKINGEIYIEVKERTLESIARNKFKDEYVWDFVSTILYIKHLEELGYKVEKRTPQPEYYPFSPIVYPETIYYIYWDNVSIVDYLNCKEQLKEERKKYNDLKMEFRKLQNENEKITKRNLFKRILNKN